MVGDARLEIRQRAYEAYKLLNDIHAVATTIGVGYSTIFRWRQDGNWDERLRAERYANLPATDDHGQSLPALASPEFVKQAIKEEEHQLEILEMRAIGAIIVDDVRPKNWRDVLFTLDYIAKRRDHISDKVHRLALTLRTRNPEPLGEFIANDPELDQVVGRTQEEIAHVEHLVQIIKTEQTSMRVMTEVVRTTPPDTKRPMTKEVQAEAQRMGIVLPELPPPPPDVSLPESEKVGENA